VTGRFFWSGQTTRRWVISGRRWRAKWQLVQSRAMRSHSRRVGGGSETGGGLTSGRRDKGANTRWAATTGGRQCHVALYAVSMATKNWTVCGTG
jgi:hypothetical protein